MNKQYKYYTYQLIDPRNNTPFYVGKGSDYRYIRHEGLVKKGKIPNNNTYLFRKINKILKSGLKIKYFFVKKGITERESYQLEIEEIKRLKNKGIKLCNLTDGGDGVTMTPEIKKKISLSEMGKIVSKESRKKMSLSKLGKKDSTLKNKMRKKWMIGHKVTNECKEKLREAHLGKFKKEQNGKYIKYSKKVLNDIKKLYLFHNKVSIVKNILNSNGTKISYDVIIKRLKDMNLYD